MNQIFLILGYGVPKDIFQDQDYISYLNMAFNQIYDLTLKAKENRPIIICGGGKTDCFPPFDRTEAEEMVKFLTKLSQREFTKEITKNWNFIAENESLSTLENLLNSKNILLKKSFKNGNFCIFCEWTRERRIKILAKKIFGKNYKISITPIDFISSAQRFADSEIIKRKEKAEIEHAFWALEKPKNLQKHHELFQNKVDILRKVNPKERELEIKKFWEKFEELEKIYRK